MTKKLIDSDNTKGHRNSRYYARAVVNGSLMLLIIGMVIPSLREPFIFNLEAKNINSVIMASENGARYWYAAGLREVNGKQRDVLMIRQFQYPPPQNTCTDQEKKIWQDFPFQFTLLANGKPIDPIKVLFQVRRLECAGRLAEATKLLDSNSTNNVVFLKKMDLLQRMGQSGVAFSLAVNSTCPSNAEWCNWCMAKAMQFDNYADSEIQHLSNGSPEDLLLSGMLTIGPLQLAYQPNLIIETEVPLLITGVVPFSKDNYLAYNTVPVLDYKVRFRVWGVVLGENIYSKVFPRLIFWSEGKYHGENALGYDVSGKFSVDYWYSLPDATDAVTPFITFGNNSFAEGQKIAICSTEIAIAP